MIDLDALYASLETTGLGRWPDILDRPLRDRLDDRAHGDLPAWRDALRQLPRLEPLRGEFAADAVGSAALRLSREQAETTRSALVRLTPWRKGPFRLGDILIDAEWRSNLKWDRLRGEIAPLEERRVLDAGCGNGYYALRMRGAGARAVIGVDPTLAYVAQFQAVMHFLLPEPVHVLPIRLEEIPAASAAFDTAFSMGVLYHSRSPIEHLRALRDSLRPGGELVLETLILPGDRALARMPEGRYARMRNVWFLPSAPELLNWLQRCGFRDARLVDTSITTSDEQRTTAWMPYESLSEALDPDDPGRTVEGWPAPTRAVLIAGKPGHDRKHRP